MGIFGKGFFTPIVVRGSRRPQRYGSIFSWENYKIWLSSKDYQSTIRSFAPGAEGS
jgi:hypothetical protein